MSGSGNVAIYAIEKVHQLGGIVIACSDSSGYVVDEKGIDLEILQGPQGASSRRIEEYADVRAGDARFVADQSVWEVVCDIALPCATQNELNGSDASTLVKNGCRLVAEGANMPCAPTRLLSSTRRASRLRREGSECRWRGDQRAGDAAERFAGIRGTSITRKKRLAAIMATIHERCLETADEYGAG